MDSGRCNPLSPLQPLTLLPIREASILPHEGWLMGWDQSAKRGRGGQSLMTWLSHWGYPAWELSCLWMSLANEGNVFPFVQVTVGWIFSPMQLRALLADAASDLPSLTQHFLPSPDLLPSRILFKKQCFINFNGKILTQGIWIISQVEKKNVSIEQEKQV